MRLFRSGGGGPHVDVDGVDIAYYVGKMATSGIRTSVIVYLIHGISYRT